MVNWCQDCDRWFSSERAIQQHFQSSSAHRPVESWECDTCNRCFGSEQAADKHMDALDHHACNYECDTCYDRYRSQDEVEAHMNAYGHWDNYCKPCGRIFVNENALKMHLNSRIHRGADVACPFCSRDFVTASGLASHLEASACPRAPVVNRLSIHTFIRSKDSSQLVTRKQLEWTTELQASEHSWNGYGYECYLCHDSYNVLAGLNTHLSNAHRQAIYHCPNRNCPKEFVTLAGLFNHLESESCGYTRFERVNKSVAGFFDSRRAIQFK